jgi:hypothetical protein
VPDRCRHGSIVAVVRHYFVTRLQEPLCHVAAHASEANHAELHPESPVREGMVIDVITEV